MPEEVNDLISVSVDNLSAEIKRTLDYYTTQASGPPIRLVLLTGGASQVVGLQGKIEEVALTPCQILNPFHSIQTDAQIFTPDYLGSIAQVATVPVGLSLRAGVE